MNRPPAKVGDRVEEIDTPALVLELDAFERNLRTLADSVKGRPLRVRPHAKTHKCAEIAKRQLAHGAIGVCCQKVAEAEALVEGGINDVLVSNEVVGTPKIARLAALSKRAHIGVCVDHPDNLAALEASGAKLDVYIELEVGMRRCGIAPGPAALQLARAIHRSKNLRFAGLQAYHGRAQHMRTMEERHAAIEAAAQHVFEMKRLLEKAGIPCPIVTGAGSGTYMLEVEAGAWDEIQPGSYIFMDVDYAKNEWAAPLPRFEHALFVLATVMSRPAADRAIVDAGLKASSVDSGLPLVWRREGLTYRGASDEHGAIEIAAGAQAPALGDKLYLVPGHCDPTVNLYDWYVCVRHDRVESVWSVTARGALN
ncbi:MAG: DSD1 family PLP-dependent enzyme [Betaproteobacteria bacterium]|nr:MAG: DSD1 family PLP-dependent enzyme [Betaproteobacteria bacterium]